MSAAAEPASRIRRALVTALSRLSDEKRQLDFLDAHPGLCRAETVAELVQLVQTLLRSDLAEAQTSASAARVVAERLGDALSDGWALRAQANVLWFTGNPLTAIAFFDRAVARFEQADRADEVGRTLSSSIAALVLLGHHERAQAAAARAREIFRARDDTHRLARLELNAGNIPYRQDRLAEALAAYERAYNALLCHDDSEGMSAALHNIAVCSLGLNDFERARGAYDRLRTLSAASGLPLLAIQADYNIAHLHRLRGEYQKALDGLRVVREACRKAGDHYHVALCELDEAEIYLDLNLIPEAETMARQARARFKVLGVRYEVARSNANLAVALYRKGKPAPLLLAEARRIFAELGCEAQCSQIDLLRASWLHDAGDSAESRSLCTSALRVFKRNRSRRQEVLSRLLLARLLLAAGELRRAVRACKKALRDLLDMEAPMLEYQAQFLLGQIREAAGEHRKAYQSYANARGKLESVGRSLHGEELIIGFRASTAAVYERLVALCCEAGPRQSRAAFQYIEEAKSRCLKELMSGNARPLPTRADDGPERTKILSARWDLNRYYHTFHQQHAAGDGTNGTVSRRRCENLRSAMRQRESKFLRMVREMPASGNASPRCGSPGAHPQEVQAALKPDETLIEYFSCEGRWLAAILNRERIEVVPAGTTDAVANHLRMLQYQLSKFHLGSRYCRKFEGPLTAAVAARLQLMYDELIAPFADRLCGSSLTIVPHGLLHYVPFHALLDGNRYLIDRFTVSYAPSAAISLLCRTRRVNSSGPCLVLGVEDCHTPQIRSEVESVASAVPHPLVLLGQAATREALSEAGVRSRMIHIATHGYFREDNPLFSSIRLADSFLCLYDLYDLCLPVELLTLSGCGTGLSVVATGDELLGLTRGLLYAGVRAALLTLWDVHDGSTAEFMGSFYTHLMATGDKAAAVRRAALDLRNRYPHPYYWGPYVLVGHP